MFKGLWLHGFVLSIGCGTIHFLTVGAVGCAVLCGCDVQGLGLCVLSGGHAAVSAERPAVLNLNSNRLKS